MPRNLSGSVAHRCGAARPSAANAGAKVREATTAATARLRPRSLGARPLELEWLPLGLGKRALAVPPTIVVALVIRGDW